MAMVIVNTKVVNMGIMAIEGPIKYKEANLGTKKEDMVTKEGDNTIELINRSTNLK